MSENKKTLSKKLLWKCWWLQQLFNQMSITYDRAYANGWTAGVLPALKHLYGDDPVAMKEALYRTRDYYLCEQTFGSVILGTYLSMEEQKANGNEEITDDLIRGVKTSLMGPVSGIGDAIIGSTIRQILLAFFLPYALEGSILGPVGFLVSMCAICFAMAVPFFNSGYKLGREFLLKILGTPWLGKVTESCSIMAMFIMGAMAYKYTPIKLALQFSNDYGTVVLQDKLNAAIPGLLPLAAIFLFYSMLRKKVPYVAMILGTLAGAIIFTFIGIL